jgi:hypothetical protein
LPLNSYEFQALPPHFDESVDTNILDECIVECFPVVKSMPQLYGTCRLCLASILYHNDFLVATIPKDSSLFQTKLYTKASFIAALKDKVIKASNLIQPTGIPPHIGILSTLQKLIDEQRNLPINLVESVKECIAKNGIYGRTLSPEEMQNIVDSRIDQLEQNLLDLIHRESGQLNTSNSQAETEIEYPVHFWGGGLHIVQQSFKFPKVNTAISIELWFL